MQRASLCASRPLLRRFYARTLFLGTLSFLLSAVAAAQTPQHYEVRVNGSSIAATRPAARVGGEWFIQLEPVVKALGATLTISPTGTTLRILRSDGIIASYDGATGRVLQGSIIAGDIPGFRQIQLKVGAENLLFPVSGVIALLGVTAREDPDHDVLEIESQPPSATAGPVRGPSFQVASLDQKFGFATNGRVWQQTVNVHGEALAGSNRLTAKLDMSPAAGDSILGLRQASLRIEMPSRRAITIGDQGTYIGIDALSNTVRGLGYEWQWGQFLADVYGGRAASSTSSGLGTAGLPNYDTNLGGFGLRRKTKDDDFSFGANLFRGTRRSGTTFGAGYSARYLRNEFRLQGLAGYFSGFSLRPVLLHLDTVLFPQTEAPPGAIVEIEQETERVRGGAYGFTIMDSFTPLKSNILLFTGIWDRYSSNFLVSREESRFSALSRKSLSAVFRPLRYVSFSGSVKESAALLGNHDLERGYTYGVNASVPSNIPVILSYFRSVQMNGGARGSRFDLSQFSFQLPRWHRYSASATYSEVRLNSIVSRSVNENVSADFGRFGRFGFHDQLQFESSHNYGPDWSLQLGHTGAYLSGGIERQTAPGQQATFAPVAAINLPLPHKQNLRFSYFSVRGSRVIQFEIGGSIIRRRELVSVNSQMALIVQSSLTGQVYRDLDLDGKFTTGVDRPIPQLKVTLDEDTVTTTDSAGYFRFDGLSPGAHRIRAETATLPANFIFANDDSMVAVMPYRDNRRDYVAIPTGQIQGIVTLITLDETGGEVSQVLPDARILATGGRETFSEGDGAFVLGDLPPGAYQLRLDPALVPPSFVTRPPVLTAQVKPGQRVSGVTLSMVKAVVVRQAPSSTPRKSVPAAPAQVPPPLPPPAVMVEAASAPPLVFPPRKSQAARFELLVSFPRVSPPVAKTALQLYARGRALTQAGDFAGAVVVLNRTIEARRNFAPAFNARGYALLRIRKYPQSVADFNEAIRLNPAYSNAYHNRAAAKKILGDIAGAKADADKAKSLQ